MPRKLVISSLTLLSAFTLAGSISGTVAWYQYSTRATVAYTGTSAHCSKLLQLSVDDGTTWDTDINDADLPSVSFAPVTSGGQEKDKDLSLKQKQGYSSYLYGSPTRGVGAYENWYLADSSTYSRFELLIKVKDIDGQANETNLANDVYLTDLTIQDANNSGLDLSNAIRVHISSEYEDGGEAKTQNFLFAKEDEELAVGGFLDLVGDGKNDLAGYEWERQTCVYGGGTLVPATYDDEGNQLTEESCTNIPYQYSYKADDDTIIASEVDNEIVGGTPIGTTSATTGEYLKVTVTIWLEGWAVLKEGLLNNDSTTWDPATYIGQQFNVGMTFGVALHNSNE